MRIPHHYASRRRSGAVAAEQGWRKILDKIVFVVGVLGPLFTLPQVIKIYGQHDAHDISLLTWGAYALFDIPWIFYGLAHRDRAVTISYICWFFFNSTVALGALIFGTGGSLL